MSPPSLLKSSIDVFSLFTYHFYLSPHQYKKKKKMESKVAYFPMSFLSLHIIAAPLLFYCSVRVNRVLRIPEEMGTSIYVHTWRKHPCILPNYKSRVTLLYSLWNLGPFFFLIYFQLCIFPMLDKPRVQVYMYMFILYYDYLMLLHAICLTKFISNLLIFLPKPLHESLKNKSYKVELEEPLFS